MADINWHEWFFFLRGDGNLKFVGLVILTFLVLEILIPRFPQQAAPLKRWYANISLHIIKSALTYVILIALFDRNIEEEAGVAGYGLFHVWAETPLWLQFVVFAIITDLASYSYHRAYHAHPFLWRAHVVHHSDLDVDFTVSMRAHPFQILIETAVRLLITLALGVPLVVLLAFDTIYTLFVFFPHANIRIPPKLDRVIRWFVVTPDMHRVHHSAKKAETNSNYGDIFSFWDRLFNSYKFMPLAEQKDLTLGLEYFREPKDQTLWGVLMQPFTYNPRIHRGAEEIKP